MDVLENIKRVPGELGKRLEADSYFSDIAIVVADDNEVLAELKRKQGVISSKLGKRGMCVVVLPLEADDNQTNVLFGPMTLSPRFQVIENVALNRDRNGTGKTSLQVARRVKDVIKSTVLEGLTGAMVPDNPCIEAIDLSGEIGPNGKAHQVSFRCLEACVQSAQQVAMPIVAAVEENKVGITCATADATIYYTLNDGYPSAEENAEVYAAPIDVPEDGLVLRACAYKAGMIGSVVVRKAVQRVV